MTHPWKQGPTGFPRAAVTPTTRGDEAARAGVPTGTCYEQGCTRPTFGRRLCGAHKDKRRA